MRDVAWLLPLAVASSGCGARSMLDIWTDGGPLVSDAGMGGAPDGGPCATPEGVRICGGSRHRKSPCFVKMQHVRPVFAQALLDLPLMA